MRERPARRAGGQALGPGRPRPPDRAGAREGAGDRRAGRHVRGREGGHEGVQGEAEAGLQGPLNVLVHLAVLQELVARHIPKRQALVWRDQILTYAELLARARRVGRALCRLGLGCRVERVTLQPWESGHDHVAIYAYNGAEWLEAMFGTLHARAAFVNVNYRYVADELRFVLATSRARAIIYHAAFAPRLAAVRDDLPLLVHLIQVRDDSGHTLLPGAVDYEEWLAAERPDPLHLPYSPDDLYVLFTGGTTGLPKGGLLRHEDGFFHRPRGPLPRLAPPHSPGELPP